MRFDGEARHSLAGSIAWPDRTQQFSGLIRAQLPRCAGRNQVGEHNVQSIDGLGTGLDQVVAVFDDRPQRGDGTIHSCTRQPVSGQRSDAHRDSISVDALAAVPGGEQPYPCRQFRGDVEHHQPFVAQPVRQRRLSPVVSSTVHSTSFQRVLGTAATTKAGKWHYTALYLFKLGVLVDDCMQVLHEGPRRLAQVHRR